MSPPRSCTPSASCGAPTASSRSPNAPATTPSVFWASSPKKSASSTTASPKPYFQAGPAASQSARAALGLERPYLLYVGTVEPRKNVDLLLDAWAALPPSIAEAYDLALAGPLGWASPRTLARLQTPPAGVRYLGYVAEALLPGLFAGAAAFVYPSLYEGFGFPVAQAMAAGVPVITSAVSCLPEITGNAALLIDPRSVSELSAAIVKLLTSPSLSANLAARARAISARFTWTACAAESLDFFQKL